MSDRAFLVASDVAASYGNIRALHGVDVEVAARGITTIIGANGAGKTTLLKVLIGALQPDRGTVELDGEDVTGLPPHRRVRRGMVLVPEGRGIIARLTVEENLLLGIDARGDGDRTAMAAGSVDEIYERFEVLRDRRNLEAGLLSGGEQQMLAIGRGLLTRPSVLILDEPSLGLAPQLVDSIVKLLRDLRDQGLTLLLIEQNARQALRIADHCYLMENGQIVAEGDAESMREDPQVQDAYLGG